MRTIGTRRVAAAAMGLAVLLAACGGGGATGNTSKEAPTAAPGDALVSQDRSPIIGRNSPSLAVNPTRETNMVVVDRVDRPDYTPGVHVSSNGGASWQDVGLQLPTGHKGKLIAPTAVFDGKGTRTGGHRTLSRRGARPASTGGHGGSAGVRRPCWRLIGWSMYTG